MTRSKAATTAAVAVRGAGAALVIDGVSAARQALAYMLRDLGYSTVSQCARVDEARRCLMARDYEVVVCDYHYEGQGQTGVDLIDDMRTSGLLPLGTVVIMITGEASYAKVADAAESAVDCYLLKPHTGAELARRLATARERKRHLRPIVDAIESGNYEAAAQACRTRVESRQAHWVNAARLGSEVLLGLGRHREAAEMFEAVAESRALPWARLGVARAGVGDRNPRSTKSALEDLLAGHLRTVDAYDVMGMLQVEEGQPAMALQTYRKAASLTPDSRARLYKQGLMAYMLGETDEATHALDRAMSLGTGAKSVDGRVTMLLALLRHEAGDAAGAEHCAVELLTAAEAAVADVRLLRMAQLAAALLQSLRQRADLAAQALTLVAADVAAADFDFEAGINLVSVVAAMAHSGQDLPDGQDWVRQVALRFATSRGATDTLVSAARRDGPTGERIRRAYAEIATVTEQAMSHALTGDRARTVAELLAFAEQTGNARLLDGAQRALTRYQALIDDAEVVAGFQARLAHLAQRFGQKGPAAPVSQGGGSDDRPESGTGAAGA